MSDLPVLRQPGNAAVILVSAPLVLHPSDDDVTDRDVNVIAAHPLEELDHLVPGRPQVHLGKAGVVAETDSLSGGLRASALQFAVESF